MSDAVCGSCGETVGIHGLFRAVFFVVVLVATILTAVVVLIDQGLYAALLMISLPIGAIGFIKARYCPLVLKRPVKEGLGSAPETKAPSTRR